MSFGRENFKKHSNWLFFVAVFARPWNSSCSCHRWHLCVPFDSFFAPPSFSRCQINRSLITSSFSPNYKLSSISDITSLHWETWICSLYNYQQPGVLGLIVCSIELQGRAKTATKNNQLLSFFKFSFPKDISANMHIICIPTHASFQMPKYFDSTLNVDKYGFTF